MCTQLLTKSGWVPSASMENIIVQIRAEIVADPNAQFVAARSPVAPVKHRRLDRSRALDHPYNESEAHQAFARMCARYGWQAS